MTKDSANIDKDQTPRTKCRKKEFVPPDGGWGWIVCFTSLMANGTALSILNIFGILYVYLLEEYTSDDPFIFFKTSWIGSTCTIVTSLITVFARSWSEQYGIRLTAFFGAALGVIGLFSSAFMQQLELLYLTFGLILGVGGGLISFTSIVILEHYFKEHMGIAIGIVSMGSSICTVCLSIVLPFILESLGIKYTFIILGGLYCMLLLCSLTWKPLFHRKSENPALLLYKETHFVNRCSCSTKHRLNWKIFKNRTYLVWFLGFIFALFGYSVPIVHLVKHTQDAFPGSYAFILITCLQITSGLGSVIFKKIADFKCVNNIYMQQCAFVLNGVLTVSIPFSESFEGLIIICLLLGVCDGIIMCSVDHTVFDIVGPSDASQATSFLLCGVSIPFAVGPPMAGLLYGHLHTYKIAYVVAGVPPIIGAIIMCIIPRVQGSSPASTETYAFGSTTILDIDLASPSKLGSRKGYSPDD
ncbi:monocarboxylate transporter 10-like [Saccostrea echinata]|uniref:monocarboxylate transporter 10-like n=1 Tax=Saccostrea echinata TaxID=191078 RepID=UPI002A7FD002|nr:monocarboxylate transporter 10-like [Saccostrea echinata]